jgi:hypothetical protein
MMLIVLLKRLCPIPPYGRNGSKIVGRTSSIEHGAANLGSNSVGIGQLKIVVFRR